MTALERFRKWVEAVGGQKAAADKIGISQAAVSRILSDDPARRRGVGVDVALKIQKQARISPKSWWEER